MDTGKDIAEYINQFPPATQKLLNEMRRLLTDAAPQLTEVISYGMPALRQQQVLVYYAGYKQHIGFYPTPSAIVHFASQLKAYKTSKGAIQFPLNQPLPAALIRKILNYRMQADQLPKKTVPKKKS